MRFDFVKCHGSGNDFPLIDARALSLDDAAWATVARALADRAGTVGGDGLLLLTAGDDDHGFGMRMFNSDGSEAETCLNGLRCVARAGFEALGIDSARVRLKGSSADVARVGEIAPGVATIRTRAVATTDPAAVGLKVAAPVIDAHIPGLPSEHDFTAVAIPNPHLITFVERIDEAELIVLGSWCETAPPLIPGRANVSFVEVRTNGLYVRTFERGVGLTDSCGSAMASSVYAAGLTGRVPFGTPVTVFNRGGLVRGLAEAGGTVTIEGNASFLYDASVAIVDGTALMPEVARERSEEAEAWHAAVAQMA